MGGHAEHQLAVPGQAVGVERLAVALQPVAVVRVFDVVQTDADAGVAQRDQVLDGFVAGLARIGVDKTHVVVVEPVAHHHRGEALVGDG